MCSSDLSTRPCDRRIGFFMQYPLRGPFEIVILPVPERPHEGRQCGEAEPERDRYQIEIVVHSPASMMGVAESGASASARGVVAGTRLRRSALATTRIDDADIVTAATNGVT